MSEKNQTSSWLVILLVLVLIVPIGWYVISRLEGEDPEIEIQPDVSFLGESQAINVAVSDPKSGLRKARIVLKQGEKEALLYMKTFPSQGFGQAGTVDDTSFEVLVEPKELGFSDGKALLRMEVRDYSWRSRFKGNQMVLEKTVSIDTQAPVAGVFTGMHYINQGGAGVVIYNLSEPCPETGVAVGDEFYPGFSGYFKDPDIYMTFFAVAYDQGPGTRIFIKSTDPAGNTSRSGFPHRIRKKGFKTDQIVISDNFLNWKMPEFDIEGMADGSLTPIEKFIQVNRKIRKANYETMTQVGRQSKNVMYWDLERFLRFPRSARRANFADKRIYMYKGEKIDQQTHMGVDLASVKNAKVPAGSNGKIIFTGSEGIYGKTVIIDHGFGLLSLYCHLSQIDVEEGTVVSRGDIIGRTGTTGMAAGDHLHFSMMIHHTFVNPDEWWDSNWIKNNITSKINGVKSEQDKR